MRANQIRGFTFKQRVYVVVVTYVVTGNVEVCFLFV